MSETTAAPKRGDRLTNEQRAYAEQRFAEQAMPMAVCAELAKRWPGRTFNYRTVWGYRDRWKKQQAECVCAETSARNCAQHGNAGDAQDGGE